MQNKKPDDYLINYFFFRPLVNDTIANINKTIPTGYLTLGSTAGIIMKITNAIISVIIPPITSTISISTPLKSTISKQWFLNNIFESKKTSDYLGFFFLIWLIVWLIPKKITPKITPKAPIIYGMPISYIFIVVGQISLIRYPKIQDIAEMIMRIIPIIKNTFFYPFSIHFYLRILLLL